MKHAAVVMALAIALGGSCYRNKPAPRMTPIEVPKPVPPAAATEAPLYTLDEVLADITSGPLKYVGTGEWQGMFHVNSCVYKNAKLFVVNIYCTKTREKSSFGLVIFSPTRGYAYLYAEGSRPVTAMTRAEYITYKFEAEVNLIDAKLPRVSLDMTYAQLRAWAEVRYKRYPAGCFAGTEINKPINGCMQQLAQYEHSWPTAHKEILANPPAIYFKLVHDFRERAKVEGRDWTDK
jgi:hypothetical protein